MKDQLAKRETMIAKPYRPAVEDARKQRRLLHVFEWARAAHERIDALKWEKASEIISAEQNGQAAPSTETVSEPLAS